MNNRSEIFNNPDLDLESEDETKETTWSEKLKNPLLSKVRWAVLGASLLITGCSEKTRNDLTEFLVGKSENYEKRGNTEVLKSFDFEGSFPVDKAELNEKAHEKIKQDVKAFFDQYNSKEKFDELNSSRIVIRVSSDERPTPNWENGNEGLSRARLEQLDKAMREILKQYEFNSEIKPSAVNSFRRKTFTKKTPAGSWGVGYTPITEFNNPLTNTKFTESEVKKLSSQKKEELYAKARYAQIDFELPGKDERERQYEQLIEIMDSYNNVTLMMDQSGSMNDDYDILAKKFRSAYNADSSGFDGDTTYIVPFVTNANLRKYESIPAKDIADKIEDTRGFGSDERVFNAIQQVIDKKIGTESKEEQKAIVSITDEGIQDFSYEKLLGFNAQGKDQKIDMYFALLAENHLITFVDREGLIYEFEQFRNLKIQDGEFFPAGMGEAQRKQWVEENVTGVYLDHDGNIEFYIDKSKSPK